MATYVTPATLPELDLVDHDGDGIINLTPAQSIVYFEYEVQRQLGITGEEFLRRLDAGEYDDIYDDPRHSEIGDLEMLSHVVR